MKVALALAGLVLAGAGGAALVAGVPIIMLERGATLVIAGTVALAGGLVILALAAILGRLDRLLSVEMSVAVPRPALPAAAVPPVVETLPPPGDVLALPEPERLEAALAEPAAVPAAVEPDAAPAPNEPAHVVGSYVSGGGSYLLYSDGSIEARTAAGIHRFGSLSELKAFAGEEAAAARSDG